MALPSYLYGEFSGYGPQSGGFAPTPSDREFDKSRILSSRALTDYSFFTDPRVQSMSNMAARGLAGHPDTAARVMSSNSTESKLIRDAASLVTATGLIPGGNPATLAAGVQKMVAHSGIRMGEGVGAGSQVFGYGKITDEISKSVLDQVRKSFFNPVTGLSNRAAHGLDQTQMGQAIAQLTSRGAFAGMDIGNLTRDDKGQMQFKIEPQKFDKIKGIVSDYAASLKSAKEIFGNLPLDELTLNAERLIGASVSQMGSTKVMKDRLANINNMAAAYGADPAAIANTMMQTSDIVKMQMYAAARQDPRNSDIQSKVVLPQAFSKIAAGISEKSVAAAMGASVTSGAAVNDYARQGIFMPKFSMQAINDLNAGVMQGIAGEENSTSLLPALNLLSKGLIKDPGTKKRLESLIKGFGSATGPEEQARFNDAIANTVKDAGYDTNIMRQQFTDAELQGGISSEYASMYTDTLDAQKSNRLLEGAFESTRIKDKANDILNDEGKLTAVKSLYSSFSKSTRDEIMDAASDPEKLAALYAKRPELQNIMSLEDLKKTLGAAGTDTETIKDMFTMVDTQIRGAAVESKENKLEKQASAVQHRIESKSLGTGEQGGFMENVIRSFTDTGEISDEIAMQSLINSNPDKLPEGMAAFKLKKDKTGLDITSGEIDSLKATLGEGNFNSLINSLGLAPEDNEGLARALQGPAGMQELMKNLGGGIMKMEGDNAYIASEDLASKTIEDLEKQAAAASVKELTGKSPTALETVEGRTGAKGEIRSALEGANLTSLASELAGVDFKGAKFEALRSAYGSDPQLKTMLNEQITKAESEGESGKDKAESLRNLKGQLETEGGGKGTTEYMGILQILSDGMAQLGLYKK